MVAFHIEEVIFLIYNSLRKVPDSLGGLCFVMYIFKKKIFVQIDIYLQSKEKHNQIVTAEERQALLSFAKQCKRQEIGEITIEDLQKYREYLSNKYPGQYSVICFMKYIRQFFKYYARIGETIIIPDSITEKGLFTLFSVVKSDILFDMKTPKKMGRPLDVKTAQKIRHLRDNAKLSFREIARALNKDVANVHRWYNYPINTTEREEAVVES
jgi:hypothetical protein